jgi:phospholipase/carboxylesterase
MDEFFIDSNVKSGKSVFLFHGYGADKENLVPTGAFISKHVKNTNVVIMDGVEQCETELGYQWFSYDLSREAGESEEKKIRDNYLRNVSKIESAIDEVMSRRDIHYEDVVMMGFSQGASVALDLGLRKGVLAIVSFAGTLVDFEVDISVPKRTAVLLAHGTHDRVVPFSYMKIARDELQQRGMHVECLAEEYQGHCISSDMLNGAIDFLNGIIGNGRNAFAAQKDGHVV